MKVTLRLKERLIRQIRKKDKDKRNRNIGTGEIFRRLRKDRQEIDMIKERSVVQKERKRQEKYRNR